MQSFHRSDHIGTQMTQIQLISADIWEICVNHKHPDSSVPYFAAQYSERIRDTTDVPQRFGAG